MKPGDARTRQRAYPHARLQRALQEAGIPVESHDRAGLRSLIHRLTGSPPPDHCTPDMLAELALSLSSRGPLRKKP